MTRAVHGRFLKDENADISDHLRNHVHLTNCIHLKNHMHRHSPILAERSLVRDLMVLQRSRSLRDPSNSPPSWRSPTVAEALSKKQERDAAVREGRRRSTGTERRRESARLSGSFAPARSIASSKVAAAEVIRGKDEGAFVSDRSSMSKTRDARGTKGEESSRRSRRSDLSGGLEEPLRDDHKLLVVKDLVSGKEEPKGNRILHKGKHGQSIHPKTLSEQLNESSLHSDDVQSFDIHERRLRQEKSSETPQASIPGHRNELTRMKRRKFRGARRTRASMGSKDFGMHSELSVASNSLAQGSTQHKYHMEGQQEEDAELDGTMAPGNGCGIPWNWSRIHHRGKTILDMAGRSLSCGRSDSRLRKCSSISHGRDGAEMPVASNSSSLSPKSDAESTPLLVEPSGSQESTDRAAWLHGCSGELGIFADHCLKHDIDSDLASEAQSDEQQKIRGYLYGRHQSLTQKYMPRTFRDLVGQNLVVQALSNAVLKRKIGFLYVFYGPHGTGKTSCARIFARALNCQSSEHPKPCGVCSSCIAHDLGKSRNVREVGPVGNFNFESIMDLLDNMVVSQLQSQYRVFIFDDCDTLPPDSWSAISKVIDRAPRRVVFVLISTNLDHLPHIIMSRCQKFFFPKLKDANIIYTLQWIATKEDLEIDKDALKLIASRSDGSLRDAEMTLEQLSLLGQKITVPLVQELVGLISDEKLVDLLDLALSADTVNTVKNLREIMEAGGEPLALMSQLATIITDILAGSYVFTKERLRRKFFRQPILSKDDMEKLRQALKTLSEAEKQLRTSNDKLTWLTAALLQLAPDQQYLLPSSSTETSFNHTPVILNNSNGRYIARKGNVERGLSTSSREKNLHIGSADDFVIDGNAKVNGDSIGGKKHAGMTPQQSTAIIRVSGGQISGKSHKDIEDIWLAVLEKIEISTLKHFMRQEGKLVSVSFGAAPTVQLTFRSNMTKSKAEKYRGHILQAFESVLGSPVTIEIRCESTKDARGGNQASEGSSSHVITNKVYATNNRITEAGYNNELTKVSKDKAFKGVGSLPGSLPSRQLHSDSLEMATSEIIEISASPRGTEGIDNKDNLIQSRRKGLGRDWIEEKTASSSHQQVLGALPEKEKIGEQLRSQSLVRGKVSLAHVIQQAEGGTQRNGWSRRKAISIAEKLEQENLRLEPRSRSLLCWKASKLARRKLSHLRFKTRRRSLMKLVPCSRCLSAKSPR